MKESGIVRRCHQNCYQVHSAGGMRHLVEQRISVGASFGSVFVSRLSQWLPVARARCCCLELPPRWYSFSLSPSIHHCSHYFNFLRAPCISCRFSIVLRVQACLHPRNMSSTPHSTRATSIMAPHNDGHRHGTPFRTHPTPGPAFSHNLTRRASIRLVNYGGPILRKIVV